MAYDSTPMLASRIRSSSPAMERYVFRPFGQLAIAGSGALLVLFLGLGAQYADSGQATETAHPTPTLNLSVAGDFQQAVHFRYLRERGDFYQGSVLVAPLYVLTVAPREWLKVYTHSPLGLPHSARARIYKSDRPQPCYSQVMIGCVEVDTESHSLSIPLYPEAAPNFGFRAPSAPGAYWIALDADWGSGGSTQVFVIDVRA